MRTPKRLGSYLPATMLALAASALLFGWHSDDPLSISDSRNARYHHTTWGLFPYMGTQAWKGNIWETEFGGLNWNQLRLTTGVAAGIWALAGWHIWAGLNNRRGPATLLYEAAVGVWRVRLVRLLFPVIVALVSSAILFGWRTHPEKAFFAIYRTAGSMRTGPDGQTLSRPPSGANHPWDTSWGLLGVVQTNDWRSYPTIVELYAGGYHGRYEGPDYNRPGPVVEYEVVAVDRLRLGLTIALAAAVWALAGWSIWAALKKRQGGTS
jgi:hypothetical protein